MLGKTATKHPREKNHCEDENSFCIGYPKNFKQRESINMIMNQNNASDTGSQKNQ